MNLARSQELFLDAAELSIEFLHRIYGRLLETLRNYDPERPEGNSPNAIILDTWGIVDHAERLREVLEHTPGLKQTEALERFRNKLRESVKGFRDHFQHMEEKAAGIASSGYPIWGSVSWCKVVSEKTIHVYTYVPGRLAKFKGLPVVNPAGRKFHEDIDHIELCVDQDILNLSELCREIERFGIAFESALSAAVREGKRDSNGLLRFEISSL